MAIKSISYGKFSIKELDPDGNEFTENIAYVKENLAGGGSAVAKVSDALANFSKALVEDLTKNTLKTSIVTYDVELEKAV